MVNELAFGARPDKSVAQPVRLPIHRESHEWGGHYFCGRISLVFEVALLVIASALQNKWLNFELWRWAERPQARANSLSPAHEERRNYNYGGGTDELNEYSLFQEAWSIYMVQPLCLSERDKWACWKSPSSWSLQNHKEHWWNAGDIYIG